jgi:peptidoglycan-N-acetylglucosamine deacetylase
MKRRSGRRRRGAAIMALVAAIGVGVALTVVPSAAHHRPPGGASAALGRSVPAVPQDGALRGSSKARLKGEMLRIAPLHPGLAHVFISGPARPEIALTFDDGFCAACAARIIHTLTATGAHATIFPNGVYSRSWDPLATAIRRLVALGQLTIGNHTFLHHDAREESASAFQADLADDELWIERTFRVSARPFFRPPYGAYDSGTLSSAGSLGYTKVIIWSGTVADSSPRTVGYIVGAIRHWARPGAIILMHANYPATSLALPRILAILRQRDLRPVTLDELLGV